MLYLDSSAIVKLVVEEPESAALGRRLHGRPLVSSELALAEVPRAVWRVRDDRSAAEQATLRIALAGTVGRLAFVRVDGDLLRAAGEIGHATLRTLDAIHLAAALTIVAELEAAVTYDARQAEAFVLGGLAVESPGET